MIVIKEWTSDFIFFYTVAVKILDVPNLVHIDFLMKTYATIAKMKLQDKLKVPIDALLLQIYEQYYMVHFYSIIYGEMWIKSTKTI